MVNSERISQIADNIEQLIYDFIPEMEGIIIPNDTKLKIVKDTLNHVSKHESKKEKSFLALPQPFIADWVCKHKEEIKDLIYKELNGLNRDFNLESYTICEYRLCP